jgi:hypothetical protein
MLRSTPSPSLRGVSFTNPFTSTATMAPVFNELRRPLGTQSSTHRRRLDVEAHDVPAGPLAGTRAPHRVDPPEVNLGAGGDYEYDEAHDFGAS